MPEAQQPYQIDGDGIDVLRQVIATIENGAEAVALRLCDPQWRWPAGILQQLRDLLESPEAPRVLILDAGPSQAAAARVWLNGTPTEINGEAVGLRTAGGYALCAEDADVRISLLPEWSLHNRTLIGRDWLLGQTFDRFIIDCAGLRTMDSQCFNLLLSWRQLLTPSHDLLVTGVNRRCQELIRQMRLDLIFTVERCDDADGSAERGGRSGISG
jgi:ABC-type transporter Mla MlaB component